MGTESMQVTSSSSTGASEEPTDDTDTSVSELTSESGSAWSACDGEVPTECLGIAADTASCPGEVGGCEWHACASDRSTRAHIDWIQCLAKECGFEPTHDIECLETWADLVLQCFENECRPSAPQACTFLNIGAQSDCHK